MRNRININGVIYEAVESLNESSNELHDRISDYSVEEDDGWYYVVVDFNDKFYRMLGQRPGSGALASNAYKKEREAVKEMSRVYRANQKIMDEFGFNDEDKASLRAIADEVRHYDGAYNHAIRSSHIYDGYDPY